MTDRQLRQLGRHLVRKWSRILGLDRISYHVAIEVGGAAWATVDMGLLHQGKAAIALSTLLCSKPEQEIESAVIHELLHIALYPYARIAQSHTTTDKQEELLIESEEVVVNRLERVLLKLGGE